MIEYELEFLESKLDELKQYIEANPFSTLTDRMAWKETKGGGAIPICIANKEAQRKDLTQAFFSIWFTNINAHSLVCSFRYGEPQLYTITAHSLIISVAFSFEIGRAHV